MTHQQPPERPDDLQPRRDSRVLAYDLHEFEVDPAAEHLRRLAEDQGLINALQWVRFAKESPEWAQLARALIEYGYSVCVGWAVAGVIYERAHARNVKGLRHLPEGLKLSHDDAHALAVTLLVDAVESFRTKVLLTDKWTSRGGASLKTYFIGWCLFGLPGAYQRWHRAEMPVTLPANREDQERHAGRADPERLAVAAAEIRQLQELIGDRVAWEMFELHAAGFSYDQIADMFETTEGSVRSRLTRARARVRRGYGHDASA